MAVNCCNCGRTLAEKEYGAVRLKDGSYMCGSCVRRLRVMYPLQYTFDEKKREVVTKDPLRELTADEALAANGQVVTYREDLREQYGFHNAVFVVDAIAESREGLSVQHGDLIVKD